MVTASGLSRFIVDLFISHLRNEISKHFEKINWNDVFFCSLLIKIIGFVSFILITLHLYVNDFIFFIIYL